MQEEAIETPPHHTHALLSSVKSPQRFCAEHAEKTQTDAPLPLSLTSCTKKRRNKSSRLTGWNTKKLRGEGAQIFTLRVFLQFRAPVSPRCASLTVGTGDQHRLPYLPQWCNERHWQIGIHHRPFRDRPCPTTSSTLESDNAMKDTFCVDFQCP